MANTTWNPADLTNVTLTLSNLKATATTNTGGTRSIASLSSGKYYWEDTYTTLNTNSIACGVALSSSSLTSPGAGVAYLVRSTGGITINASVTGSALGIISSGAVIGIAVDFTAHLIWFRVAPSGNWNGSGTANPATGAGGLSISAISSGALYAYMSGGTNDAVTANFGNTAFTGAVPSGFTSGFPTAPPIELAGNIGGYDQYGKLNYGKAAYSWSAIQPALGASLNVAIGINLAGDLAPAVSFAGNLGFLISLSGGVATTVSFIGNLSQITTLSGGLAPTVSFTASLVVSTPGVFAGDLAPRVSFSASLGVTLPFELSGGVTPAVSFAGNLNVISLIDLSGGLAPQIGLGGSLSAVLPLAGDMTPSVVFAASGLLSGPLWAESAPCPPPMWAETESCLDPGWTPLTAPGDLVYQGSAYGLGGYGANRFGLGIYVPAGLSPWAPAELCNG